MKYKITIYNKDMGKITTTDYFTNLDKAGKYFLGLYQKELDFCNKIGIGTDSVERTSEQFEKTINSDKVFVKMIQIKENKKDTAWVTSEYIDYLSDEKLYEYFGSNFEYEESRALIVANFKTLDYKVVMDNWSEDDLFDKYKTITPKEDEVVIILLGPVFYVRKTLKQPK